MTTKNEAAAPEVWKIFIDKWRKIDYNETPYCDTMPIYGLYFQHGHFSTDMGGCQVATWTNLTTTPSVSKTHYSKERL